MMREYAYLLKFRHEIYRLLELYFGTLDRDSYRMRIINIIRYDG